jgi:hypothetical protein
MSSDICPACNANLQGDEIPGEYFVHGDTHDDQVNRYGQCYCLPYGDRPPEDRFFSRKIGVEIPGAYDGILYWNCPDCAANWHRWPLGHHNRVKANRYISA